MSHAPKASSPRANTTRPMREAGRGRHVMPPVWLARCRSAPAILPGRSDPAIGTVRHFRLGGWTLAGMKRRPITKVTEGEIYGAPVPGGWPDRGPFQVLGDAVGRLFGRRTRKNREDKQGPPADDGSSEAGKTQPAQHLPDE